MKLIIDSALADVFLFGNFTTVAQLDAACINKRDNDTYCFGDTVIHPEDVIISSTDHTIIIPAHLIQDLIPDSEEA